jgi:hypothetical protein
VSVFQEAMDAKFLLQSPSAGCRGCLASDSLSHGGKHKLRRFNLTEQFAVLKIGQFTINSHTSISNRIGTYGYINGNNLHPKNN